MIWRCYYVKRGQHVHMRIFCGQIKGALGMCGKLVMRDREFTEFTKVHRVLAMEFIRETDEHGRPAGDSDVFFDQFQK